MTAEFIPVEKIFIRDLSLQDKILVDLFHFFQCKQCKKPLYGHELICPIDGNLISFICEDCKLGYDLLHN